MNKKNRQHPARIAEALLRMFLPERERYDLLGDYEEYYKEIFASKGGFNANLWYWMQIMILIPTNIWISTKWSLVMMYNYLKIVIRNIRKHKMFSVINITGLALGMACCLLIMLWVFDELSYDRFHENAFSLYRVEQDSYISGERYHGNSTPYPMGPALKNEIPEVEDAARYGKAGDLLFRYEDKLFFETAVRAVDPSFLRMFTFPFINGNAATALDRPHSLVISEEVADKYFEGEDPLGKVIKVNSNYDFTVTGVMKNVPHNSFLKFSVLIPFTFIRELGNYNDSWSINFIPTFVKLGENASTADVNKKITQICQKHLDEDVERADHPQIQEEQPSTWFTVNPFTNLHLHEYWGSKKPIGNVQYVYIFTVIALVVLFVACINFMSLATAKSATRAREVGIRKTVGALRSHLIHQFYRESIVLAFIALFFAIILTILLLPQFNVLSGKELSLSVLLHWKCIVGMFTITLLTGIFSGSYPALFLSSFQPVNVLKGSLNKYVKSVFFRKTLVVIQFSLSILLIIGTVVASKQIHYMQNKKLGYDKEHLITITLRGDTGASYTQLKNELKKDARVVNVTATMQPPGRFSANSGSNDWEGKDPEQEVLIGINSVDFDYVETFGIDMADGRPFSVDFSTDIKSAWIINEELAKIIGMESAVGKWLTVFGIEGTIIGVMKNYHFKPVRNIIEPLALTIKPEFFNHAVIRLQAGNIPDALDYVKTTWERVLPDYPFDYRFLDQDLDEVYRTEQRVGGLLQTFAILSIVIACLGLFGLASFTAEQRTKEIGIRKVLGSSVSEISLLLSKEFTKWVLLANIIAWPIAYISLNKWLQNFAYRISFNMWIFILSGLAALVIALLTVSYQTIKAATANPVESLRYE